ncbi:hypothetical protein [Pseudomonas sp. NPDC089569]
MLAMVVNDDAGCLIPRGALASIASMLAPTGESEQQKNAPQLRGIFVGDG